MKKIKDRLEITSNFQLIIILLVFSITGSIAVWIAEPILLIFGIDKLHLSIWVFWPIRILIIFPIYQILILIIGTLFGQFKFFWKFEKKMLKRLGFQYFQDK